MVLIATFYSHFGAIRFKKECAKLGISANAMPVPRDLSSSCGTCVRFETGEAISDILFTQEMEQLVKITDKGYEILWKQT